MSNSVRVYIFCGLLFVPVVIYAQGISDYKTLFKNINPVPSSEILLLGVGESPGFKTVVIQYSPQKPLSVFKLPFIATPQPAGFYYLQSVSGEDGISYREFTDMGIDSISYSKTESQLLIEKDPVTLMKKVKDFAITFDGISEDEQSYDPADDSLEVRYVEYEESSTRSFSYIIPGFITLWEASSGFTGGAHGFRYNDEQTFQLVDAKPGEKANFSSQFTSDEWRMIERRLFFQGVAGYFDDAYERPNKPLDLSAYDKFEVDNDSTRNYSNPDHQVNLGDLDFLLRRRRGLIEFSIEAHASASYAESGDYRLTTSTAGDILKPPFIAYNSFPISWESLQKTEPGLIDALVSPGNNILVVLSSVSAGAHQLKVIEIATGKVLLTKSVEFNYVFMADWAVGKNVERWLTILRPHAMK